MKSSKDDESCLGVVTDKKIEEVKLFQSCLDGTSERLKQVGAGSRMISRAEEASGRFFIQIRSDSK
jgi:hypothetical protein